MKILKLINQSIVLCGMQELKEGLLKGIMTKDVRTSDGWRIVISINDDIIQVSHIRREQSLDEFGDRSNHFEFEWELRMTFDKHMIAMNATRLRIDSLDISQVENPDKRSELQKLLIDGLIVK